MGMEKINESTYLLSGKVRDHVDERLCIHVGGTEVATEFNKFTGKFVTLRYWVFNRAIVTVEEATELMLEDMFTVGGISSKCIHHYSEMTGYLYTTEECIVGGHDILRLLEGYMGMHLLMEIQVHQSVNNEFYKLDSVKELTSTELLMNMIRVPPTWDGGK